MEHENMKYRMTLLLQSTQHAQSLPVNYKSRNRNEPGTINKLSVFT